MAKITVTPETLRTQAGQLRGHKNSHDAAITSFKNVVNGTSADFTGDAAEAYRNQFATMEPTLKSFSEMLEGFAKLLETAANTMEQTDQSLASTMKSFG